MDNVGLYSVCKEMRKTFFKIIQIKSFASHSRVGKVAKWLAKYSLAKYCLDSNMCFSRGLSQVVHLWTSHELVANFTFLRKSSQTLILNPYIKSHKYIGKRLTEYNQIWHGIKANKAYLKNHNFIGFLIRNNKGEALVASCHCLHKHLNLLYIVALVMRLALSFCQNTNFLKVMVECNFAEICGSLEIR